MHHSYIAIIRICNCTLCEAVQACLSGACGWSLYHVFMCMCRQWWTIVKHGLNDENQKVKTITALTVSALAEAASPYGIESFDDVLEPLWKGIRLLRGKVSCCLMCLLS